MQVDIFSSPEKGVKLNALAQEGTLKWFLNRQKRAGL